MSKSNLRATAMMASLLFFAFGNKTFIEFFHLRISSTGRARGHKEGFADERIALFREGGSAFFQAGVIKDDIKACITDKLFEIGDKLEATSFRQDGEDGDITESFSCFDFLETLFQIRLGFH
jgi:hypothetical protein